jgi:uncharacterized protein DUF6152
MTMKSRWLVPLGAVVFLTASGGQAVAHHSISAMYMQDQSVTIKGTLREFLWRNPHSLFKVEALDENGVLHVWVIEGAAPTQLQSDGMTRTTLKPNDQVIVTGRPGRGAAGDFRMLLQRIERPSDGFKWQGNSN